MKVIKQTYLIKAPIENVWQALVDPKIIDSWGGGPAKMSAEKGFEFSLWGGDIHGHNIKVEPNKQLVQAWMGGKWDDFSKATFDLTPKGNKTQLKLTHEYVPVADFEDIKYGWKSYYLGPLKKLLEK